MHHWGVLHLPQRSALVRGVQRVLQPRRALALIIVASRCQGHLALSASLELLKVIILIALAVDVSDELWAVAEHLLVMVLLVDRAASATIGRIEAVLVHLRVISGSRPQTAPAAVHVRHEALLAHHLVLHECLLLLQVVFILLLRHGVPLARLVLTDLRDFVHLTSRLVVIVVVSKLQEATWGSLVGRFAVDVEAKQRVLLGEEATHVDRLLVVLDLVGLDAGIQVYHCVRAGLIIIEARSGGINLLTSLILGRII